MNLDLNDLLRRLGRWWHFRKQKRQAKKCTHQWIIYEDSVYSQCDGCHSVIKTMTLLRLQQEHGDGWETGIITGRIYGVRILDTSAFIEISYPLTRTRSQR